MQVLGDKPSGAHHRVRDSRDESRMYRPVLGSRPRRFVRVVQSIRGRSWMVAGLCGLTSQPFESRDRADLRLRLRLAQLGALADASIDELLAHCRRSRMSSLSLGSICSPAVGGRVLDYAFGVSSRTFGSLAVKIAPCDRYRTIQVVRAIGESAREEVALYPATTTTSSATITPFR